MHTFIKKYPGSVFQALIWLIICLTSSNALWAADLPYTTERQLNSIGLARPPRPQPFNISKQPIFDADPILFQLTANKRKVKLGEEFELTITAQYMKLRASQLFILPSSNAFRLKLLLPEGFIQTGGTYVDYIGTELSTTNPSITYTLKGYFSQAASRTEFRLLRGSAQATETSLFIDKTQTWIQVEGRQEVGRQAAARLSSDYANLNLDCSQGLLTITGVLTTSTNQVSILIFKDESIVSTASDLPATNFSKSFPISGPGIYYAKIRELNNDGNEINSAAVSVNCSGGTPTPNPPTSGCNYNQGQFLLNFYGEAIYAHQTNGTWYAAYQDGSNFKPRHWLVAAGYDANLSNCFTETDPRNGTANPPTNPNPTTSGGCSVGSPRGHVDALTETGIWGWALDESDLTKTVIIDVYVNGVKVASGKAREDRSDLISAFGNNPAARYHGFHAEWDYNREGNNSYTITAKICGTNTVLANQQISFSNSSPGARKEPCEGCKLLNAVTVRAARYRDNGQPSGDTEDWDGGSSDSGTSPGPGPDGGHNGGNNPGGTGTGSNGSGNSTFKDINDSNLKPCIKAVLSALRSNAQIPDIIKQFSGSSKDFNWIVRDGDLGENINAQTLPYDRVNRIATTTFDANKYVDATDLSIARTIIHESVHAYLVTYFATDPLMANAAYPDMVVAWMGAKRPDLNQIQHDEMVYSFVSDIASSLKIYGRSKGYVTGDDYYFKLAWGGLESTNAFGNLNDVTRASTKDVIRIELTGKKTDGESFKQVGQKAGCP